MHVRDRVKELRRVKAAELQPNPKNWRSHPPYQRDMLAGVLEEVGYADALLVRELADGKLELIDGHLRAETTPETVVPVLVLDVTAEEADKILATHDPLAAMARADAEQTAKLVQAIETENKAMQEMLAGLVEDNLPKVLQHQTPPPEVPVVETFQVVVECDGEQQQREVYQRLTGEGYACRVLTL